MKKGTLLGIGSGNSRSLFEPGDYLRKIAEEEIKGKTPSEIKKNISDIMDKKVNKFGAGRYQTQIRVLDSRSQTGQATWQNSPDDEDFRTQISSAEGVIIIRENASKSEIAAKIPFFLRDGKLLPFDIIEMGGRKFVFSDHNLYKVLEAIKAVNKNPNILDEDSSFEEIAEIQNNTTDAGNLRQILNVRNREMTNGLGLEQFASILDDSLEKTASFQKVTRPMIQVITDKAMEIAREKIAADFEKVAGNMEETSERILQAGAVFSDFKKLPWKDAKSFGGGSCQIVDFDKNRENLKVKDAVLFTERMIPLPASWDHEKNKAEIKSTGDRVIIDADGNYKVLRAGTKIYDEYKLVANGPDFQIKSKSLEDMVAAKEISDQYGAKFLIKDGDKVIGPVKIMKGPMSSDALCSYDALANKDREVQEAGGDALKDVFYRITSDVLPGDKTAHRDRQHAFLAAVRPDAKALTFGTMSDSMAFLENLYKTDAEMDMIRNNFDEEIFWLSNDIQLIPLNDQIITPVTNIKQIILDGSDDEIKKVAGADTVYLKKPVADKDNYVLELSKGRFDKKIYRGIKRNDAIAIMKNAGIPENEVIGMFGFLDSGEREITRHLPLDLSRLKGEDVQTEGNNIAGKFLGKYFNPGEAQKALKSVVGEVGSGALANQVAAEVVRRGPDAFRALETITSLASDAEALADRFEKVAMDHKSRDFQNIAKLMVVTSRMDKFLQKAASETVSWDVSEHIASVRELQEPIEKAASLLYEMKQEQAVMGREILGNNTLTQGLRTLDRLYNYSCSL